MRDWLKRLRVRRWSLMYRTRLSWEDAAALKFFETSTRNLLTYEAAAGVGHHVALSVVGTERFRKADTSGRKSLRRS